MMVIIDFILCLSYWPPTPPTSFWHPTDEEFSDKYENGKMMLPIGQLVEELWEVWRFHRWYMNASNVSMMEFVVRVPKESFLLDEDRYISVELRDMHSLLPRQDLNVTQVTLFAL